MATRYTATSASPNTDVDALGGGAPAAHAASHADGGSDPITPDSIGAMPVTDGNKPLYGLDMDGNRIEHVDDPVASDDAATKGYVDALVAATAALVAPVALGTAYNAGTSTAAYLDVPGTPTAAPTLAAGQSLVILFRPVSTPGGAQIIAHHDDGGATRGWHLYAGYEAGDRSHLSLYLAGLTGTGTAGTVPLTGATFAGALLQAHILAIAMLLDGTLRYSWDGGTVQVVAAPTGTYVPPQAGDPYMIGQRSGSNGATSIQPVALRTYSTVLSDADLVAVAASRTDYRLAAPAVGTLSGDLHAEQFRGAATVIDRASGQRWRLVGGLSLHEQS